MKNKTKKYTFHLQRLFIAALMCLPIWCGDAWAQKAYVVKDGNTLTFFYDDNYGNYSQDKVSFFDLDGEGYTFGNQSITDVVFDSSFSCAMPKSCAWWFYDCTNLKTIYGLSNLNTNEVKDMSFMFAGCKSLTSLDFSGYNAEKVTNMSGMFYGCKSLNRLNLSGFTTENVTNMNDMFAGCESLTQLNLSGFNTEYVTDMGGMFYDCKSLATLDLSGLNTEYVTNMYGMFYGCKSLTTLDLSGFNVEKVTNMNEMFYGCNSITSLDFSGLNTENVMSMDGMFQGCESLTSLDLSMFNTESVTNMHAMFKDCKSLTTILASCKFDTNKVSYGEEMFSGCCSLKGDVEYSPYETDVTYAKFIDGYFIYREFSYIQKSAFALYDENTETLTFIYDS